jgi:hypothetical protein
VPLWTWCFRAELYTLFKIDPRRSADVLLEVLGTEFDGVLGCDCFSAYRRYMRQCDVVMQFCLAHLIRDVKFLLTLPGRHDRAYGQRLCDALRALFIAQTRPCMHDRGVAQARGWRRQGLRSNREDPRSAGQGSESGHRPNQEQPTGLVWSCAPLGGYYSYLLP